MSPFKMFNDSYAKQTYRSKPDLDPNLPAKMQESESAKNPIKRNNQIITYTTATCLDLECIFVKDSFVFVADISGCIYQFSLELSKPIKSFLNHEARVTCLFVIDNFLFSTSEDCTMKLWDIERGEVIRTMKGHSGAILSLCITIDNRIYTGGLDKTICEWSIHGRRKWVLTGSKSPVKSIASSPKIQNRIYTVDGLIVRCWDTSSGRCVNTFQHDNEINCIVLHNTLLFSASQDGKIVMWHALDGTQLAVFCSDSTMPIHSLCIAQNQVYSAGASKSIVCWNMETYTPSNSITGHTDVISGLVYCSAKNAIISCSTDGTFKVWPLENKTVHRAASFHGSYVSSRKLTHRNSSSAMSEVSVESFQSLQEQLQITQELLNKQERNKLRLKGELSGTQHELSKLKMELAETRKRLVQTEAAVVELEAAKELLVSYSSDLQTSQEAHAISLDLIFKTSDRQYHTTAMELVSFHKLLHDGYSLTYREKKPKAMIPDRKWDFDEDWDSDRDVPDVDCWWRNQDPYFSTEPEINDTPILRKRQSVSEILQGSTVPVKKGINKRRTIHISQLPPIHHSPDQLPPLDNFPRIHDTLDQPSIDDIGEETFLLQSQLQKDSIATLFRRKSIAEMKRAKIPNSTNQSWSVLPSWLKYGQKEP